MSPITGAARSVVDAEATTTTALKRVLHQCRIGDAPVVHGDGGEEAQAGGYGGRHHLLGVVTVDVDAIRDQTTLCLF